MAATPIYGKTKYVSLYAVVDLDLFYNYKGDQVSASGPSGSLVYTCAGLKVNLRHNRLWINVLAQC